MLFSGKIHQIAFNMPSQLGFRLFTGILKKQLTTPCHFCQSFLASAKESYLEIRLTGLQIIPGQISGRGWHQIGIIHNLLYSLIQLLLPIGLQIHLFLLKAEIILPQLFFPFRFQLCQNRHSLSHIFLSQLYLLLLIFLQYFMQRSLNRGKQGIFPLGNLLLKHFLQLNKLIIWMVWIAERGKIKACWLNAPIQKSLPYPLTKAVKGQFRCHMLIYLIHHQINHLAGLSQIPGKGKIQLRLHMIIIHNIENNICQMQCFLCRLSMGIISRVYTRGIHNDYLLRQGQITAAKLYFPNGIPIPAETAQKVIIIGSQIFPWLILMKINSGIILPRLAFMHPYQIGTGRNRTGGQ